MNNITVYTITQCPYCVMIKNFLTGNFKEVNVEKDPVAMQRVVQTTGQMGVPQTRSEWHMGFRF